VSVPTCRPGARSSTTAVAVRTIPPPRVDVDHVNIENHRLRRVSAALTGVKNVFHSSTTPNADARRKFTDAAPAQSGGSRPG
jgi:hypothetical protein